MSSNGAHAYAPLNCMCFRSLARGICFHLFACFRFYDGLPVMDNFHYETVEHFRGLFHVQHGRYTEFASKNRSVRKRSTSFNDHRSGLKKEGRP